MKKLIFVVLGFFTMSAFTVPVNKEDLKELKKSLEQAKQVQSVKSIDVTKNELFCMAVESGNEDYSEYKTLEKMIKEEGAYINTNSCYGRTPLIHSIEGEVNLSGNRSMRVIKLLVSNGADVNMQDNESWTALMWAVHKGRFDIVKYLVGEGNNFDKAQVNMQDNEGWTALMLATVWGDLETVKYLVGEGNNFDKAQVNIQDKRGWTALMRAAAWGHLETVKYLVENEYNKAIISFTNNEGKNAIDLAREEGYPEIVQYLEEQMKK